MSQGRYDKEWVGIKDLRNLFLRQRVKRQDNRTQDLSQVHEHRMILYIQKREYQNLNVQRVNSRAPLHEQCYRMG